MSAFMCSDLHLSVLAIYAVRHGLYRCPDTRLEFDPLGREKAAFTLLARQNLSSLAARYPGDRHEDAFGELNEKARPLVNELAAVSLIKQCHCYSYQACEDTGWERSEAKRLVNDIEAHAVRHLPGYEAAPWGL